MEDDRYEWRKQNDPDFVASAASGGSSTNPHEGSKDDEGADDEIFDAALEKRRKHRREMNNNTHNKLDKLVAVAALVTGICGGSLRKDWRRWPMERHRRTSSLHEPSGRS